MKKKLFFSILLLLVAVTIVVGSLSIHLDAAICKPAGDIGTCEGECCKLTKTGCIAGPCSVVL